MGTLGPSSLTAAERQWLLEEAQDTLGLTDLRVKILVAVLSRERYSIREVARDTEMSPEQVRVAIETLFARDLIEVRSLGTRLLKGYKAVPGQRLRFLLDAVFSHLQRLHGTPPAAS